MKLKQLIIIGGGASINQCKMEALQDKLKERFTIGINYSYKYFQSTCLVCMNYTDFYNINRKELSKLPLIVSCHRQFPSKWEKNTILVDKNYMLSGILALDVGMRVLEEGEIFLLGYDYNEQNNKTHFYQGKIDHRGIGKSAYYDRGFEDRDFRPFCNNKKIKIYNVSMKSRIKCFSKLTYNKFYKKLDDSKYNQEGLVKEIKRRLGNV